MKCLWFLLFFETFVIFVLESYSFDDASFRLSILLLIFEAGCRLKGRKPSTIAIQALVLRHL